MVTLTEKKQNPKVAENFAFGPGPAQLTVDFALVLYLARV